MVWVAAAGAAGAAGAVRDSARIAAEGAAKVDTVMRAAGMDSAWYNMGMRAAQRWMREGFPVVYCDTAYSRHNLNVVIRALLAKDGRVRVRTSISGHDPGCPVGEMIRFVTGDEGK